MEYGHQAAKITLPMNALQRLREFEQSPWLDFIRRGYVQDGSLQRQIEQGIVGVTSNPAIFEKAIAGSHDYDDAIFSLTAAGHDAETILDILSIEDVAMAADLFKPVYEASNGLDGYVSLEVDPRMAHDAEMTVQDGRRLWKELGRPNVMIKVPATQAGVEAFQTLTAEGINVNVTLLFSVERYVEIAEAYIRGLEERAQSGGSLRVASVASFFVSRVDTLLDPDLEVKAPQLAGKVAIANCHMAYRRFQELFDSERFEALARKGARPQRLLWASTSAKNPSYSPTLYVDSLIGPDTVNTMPLETIDAFLEQGDPQNRLIGAYAGQQQIMDQLAEIGIDIEEVAATLQTQAIDKFVEPHEKLLAAIREKQESFVV